MMISPACRAAFEAHALRDFPRESCGVIAGGAYVPLPNAAADPQHTFVIPDDAWALWRDKAEAVVHSHPNGPAHPTRSDMEGQIATDIPWVIVATDGVACADPIVWGDGTARPGLIGRSFVHGVTDCYALIRDYFHQERGIRLPDFPRDDSWWTEGGNLYLENFGRAGFTMVPLEDLAAGDAVLMQVRAPVPNHAGVVLGDGLILHHLQERLSRREPLGPWLRFVTHALRYQETP